MKDVPDVVVGHANARAMYALKGESDHLTKAKNQTEILVMELEFASLVLERSLVHVTQSICCVWCMSCTNTLSPTRKWQ